MGAQFFYRVLPATQPNQPNPSEQTMYAVIETGGKQYKIALGDKLKVEKLDAAEGESVDLGRALMVADGERIHLDAADAVHATVLAHGRGDKIRVFKMKRRKDYRRTRGHRQAYTEIQITAIGDNTQAVTPPTKPAKQVADVGVDSAADNAADSASSNVASIATNDAASVATSNVASNETSNASDATPAKDSAAGESDSK